MVLFYSKKKKKDDSKGQWLFNSGEEGTKGVHIKNVGFCQYHQYLKEVTFFGHVYVS